MKSINVEDELSTKFLEQEGPTMDVSLSGSGLGSVVSFSFYDKYGNDIDSVCVKDEDKVREIRDLLTQILESGKLKED
ncbi:MAG: hypothetical protein K0R18_274 [Bacillales bacterium]|nr:hypothetical protein [Bacillales bacterium]